MAAGVIFTSVAARGGCWKEVMVYEGFALQVSASGRVYVLDADTRKVVAGPFASVEAAKADIEDEWVARGGGDEPTCPICDAFGCGSDGGGCYRYEGRGDVADPRYFDFEEAF